MAKYDSIHTGPQIDNFNNRLSSLENAIDTYYLTVSTTWNGAEPPYTQTITCNGITSNDTLVIGLDVSSVAYDMLDDQYTNYALIYRAESLNNAVKLYANDKTESQITLIAKK